MGKYGDSDTYREYLSFIDAIFEIKSAKIVICYTDFSSNKNSVHPKGKKSLIDHQRSGGLTWNSFRIFSHAGPLVGRRPPESKRSAFRTVR